MAGSFKNARACSGSGTLRSLVIRCLNFYTGYFTQTTLSLELIKGGSLVYQTNDFGKT